MTLRQTHTVVELGVSPAAYDEIAKKLRDAGYDHVFFEEGLIDLTGIAIVKEAVESALVQCIEGETKYQLYGTGTGEPKGILHSDVQEVARIEPNGNALAVSTSHIHLRN